MVSGFRRPLIILILFFPALGSAQSLQLADSLRVKGEYFQERGNFEEAEFYYSEAYNLYWQHQDTTGWLKTGVYFAEVLYYRSKYNQALELFNLLKTIEHPVNDHALKARIESDLGLAHGKIGNLNQSVEHYNSALSLAREAKDSLMIGIALNNLAASYQKKGEYTKSLEFYKKTLPYFRTLNSRRSMVYVFNNMGTIYRELFLFDKALEYYSRSLELNKELNNVNMLASIYDRLGSLQKDLGNYDQALIAFQKSLEYLEKAGTPEKKGSTLNDIGTLYSRLGNPSRALEYFEESLKIRKDVSHPTQLATLYRNIANRELELDNFQKAVDYYERSLALRKQVGNARHIATSLLDLAQIEQQRNNPLKALAYANRVRSIADSTKDYSLLKNVYIRLGQINNKLGKPGVALSCYKKSLAYSRFLTKDSRIGPLMHLSRAYNSLESDSALVYGSQAVALIEDGRSNTGSDSGMKANYFEQYSYFYINMASWTLKYKDDIAKAYYMVEQAKARTLADELVQASQRIDEKLPEEVRIERNKMLSAIDRLYSELRAAERESARNSIESEIRKAELNYSAFQNELHEKYPRYKKLELQEPVTLYKAQSINEPKTAILEYAVNDDLLLAFFISNKEFSIKQYSLNELRSSGGIELKQLVQSFKDAILSHAGKAELDLRSSELYALLLEPFEEQLGSYTNLIIVPDGALAYLPFEAIRNNNSYLIEQFDIKYMPSITSLTLLKKPDRNQEKQLLAVAGSEVMNVNSETGRRLNSYSALPSTLIEVDSIASHFTEVTTLKEEQVTEKALKQYLSNEYKYIHLATHGFIDEDQPAQSGLRLSSTQGAEVSSENDGLLKSSEIYRLNLNSDMVVLSACNTGLGKVVKGEGMLGLQRSFFYAGTSSVVVSLWNVYDRSTAHLMNEFYKAIIDNPDGKQSSWITRFLRWTGWDDSIPFGLKATAMRTAKLDLIHHPLFNHPVYWAPFIVVGR